jgi:hypothetical protein
MTFERVLSRAMVRAGAAGFCTIALTAGGWAPAAVAQSPVTALDTPSVAGSNTYAMATGADGKTYLVWIEPADQGHHALKFSRFDGRGWQAPREIARGNNWFVNWADHPSLTAMPDGSLVAHWLVNTGRKQGSYGYGIRVARSTDEGVTWQMVFEDGMKNVSDYAGFLTFAPREGGADAIYLNPLVPDEGAPAGGHEEEHTKTRPRSLGTDGTVRTAGRGRGRLLVLHDRHRAHRQRPRRRLPRSPARRDSRYRHRPARKRDVDPTDDGSP